MKYTLWFLLILLLPLSLLGQTPVPEALTAEGIEQRVIEQYRAGVMTELERFTMTHGPATDDGTAFDGEPEVSEMMRAIRYASDGETSLIEITGPDGGSAVGTKVLSRDLPPSDVGGRRIWRLYVRLPDDREGRSFAGTSETKRWNSSGISYRDVKILEGRQMLEDYTFELLDPNGSVDRTSCFVLRARPKAGVVCEYAFFDLCIRKDVFFTIQIRTYDKSRTPRSWKIFSISALTRADLGEGRRVTRAMEVEVRDELEHYRTILSFKDRRVNVPIDPSRCTEAYVNSRETYDFFGGARR